MSYKISTYTTEILHSQETLLRRPDEVLRRPELALRHPDVSMFPGFLVNGLGEDKFTDVLSTSMLTVVSFGRFIAGGPRYALCSLEVERLMQQQYYEYDFS